MARTTLTPVEAVQDSNVSAKEATVGTAIADLVTDGAAVAMEKDDKILLIVKNTVADTDKDVTIKAGAYFRSGIGDLTVTVAQASGEQIIGPLESARFKQTDGKIYIDFAAAMTGYIRAIKLP